MGKIVVLLALLYLYFRTGRRHMSKGLRKALCVSSARTTNPLTLQIPTKHACDFTLSNTNTKHTGRSVDRLPVRGAYVAFIMCVCTSVPAMS